MKSVLPILLLAWPVCALGQPAAPPAPTAPKGAPDAPPADETRDADNAEDNAEAEVEDDAEDDDDVEVMTIFGRREQTARISGSAHVVGAAELETFEYDDIHQVLAQVPGVYVRGEDGHGLRPNIGLRGASSDRSAKLTLMEDGVLIAPAPYSAPAAYYFPLVTRITRVEVFKGPASIQHGPNTIGGAMNLTTRAIPLAPGGEIDLSAGRFDTYKTHGWFGGSHGEFGVLGEAVRLSSSGFKDLDGGGDTGFEKREAMLKLAWAPETDDAWQRLQLELSYADETSNETYLGLTDADFDATPYRRYAGSRLDRMRWTRTALQLDYDLALDDIELTLTAYRHDFHRSWYKLNRFRGAELRDVLANPDDGQLAVFLAVLRGELDSEGRGQTLLVGDNDRTFVSQGVQTRARWTWEGDWLRSQLEAGVRLHTDSIERDHTEDGYLMRSGRLLTDGQETVQTRANRGSAEALAAHVLDELRIGDDLYLTPGGRLELIRNRLADLTDTEADDGEREDVVLLGGVGAYYQALPWLGVLAGVHQGFSPVAPGQPETVEPERSVNYEAGLRLAAGPLTGEAIAFWNDYSNLTADCTISSGCDPDELGRQFSAGAVDVRGVEALLGYRGALGAGLTLDADVSYTLTDSTFAESFVSANPQFGDVTAGDALPYVPQHQGNLRLGISAERFGIDTEVGVVGEMRDVAGAGEIAAAERIAGHATWSLAAWFAPSDANRIYITASNLLDSRHPVSRRPYGLRPGAPMQIDVGYKHRFGSAR